jgi:preprotein translocase subunit SecB
VNHKTILQLKAHGKKIDNIQNQSINIRIDINIETKVKLNLNNTFATIANLKIDIKKANYLIINLNLPGLFMIIINLKNLLVNHKFL